MSERANFVIRRQPIKGSREDIVLSAAKGFYGKQFTEKVSLRLIELFEPLVVIADGGSDQDIIGAIELAEANIKDYFQQLKNQSAGYVFTRTKSVSGSIQPTPSSINTITDAPDNEQVLEPEFD